MVIDQQKNFTGKCGFASEDILKGKEPSLAYSTKKEPPIPKYSLSMLDLIQILQT